MTKCALYCVNVNTRNQYVEPAECDNGDPIQLEAFAVFRWFHCMQDSQG